MNNNILEIKYNNVNWVSIESPSKADLDYIRKNFQISSLDLEEVLAPSQRSKIDKYKNYIFLIFLFPVYNRKTKEIESSEVDFFLSTDYLITIHRGNLPPIIDQVQLCQSSQQAKENFFNRSSQIMLYNLFNKLYFYCYPILDHISLDVLNIKKMIFFGNPKKMVEQILMIRRNITDLRKIMQSHKATLEKLLRIHDDLEPSSTLFSIERKYFYHYENLIDHTKESWDQLESLKEAIEALQETNESLISFRLNNVMKILTLISVGFLPATFVATLFMTNAHNTPFVGLPSDFWIISLISALSSVILLIIIWRRRWL